MAKIWHLWQELLQSTSKIWKPRYDWMTWCRQQSEGINFVMMEVWTFNRFWQILILIQHHSAVTNDNYITKIIILVFSIIVMHSYLYSVCLVRRVLKNTRNTLPREFRKNILEWLFPKAAYGKQCWKQYFGI